MFTPMSAGADEWPSINRSATPSSSKHPTALEIHQQLSRGPHSDGKPSSAASDRQLRPPASASRSQKVGHFLGWKGKGKQKDSTMQAVPLGGGQPSGKGSTGKGSRLQGATSLEAVGWNQQSLLSETRPLLSPARPSPARDRGSRRAAARIPRHLRPPPSSAAEIVSRKARFDSIIHSTSVENLLVHSSSGQNLGSRALAEAAKDRPWYMDLFRPTVQRVEEWVDSWSGRHGVLVLFPSAIVWLWCAAPFPRSNPNNTGRPWCDESPEAPWCRDRLREGLGDGPISLGSDPDDIDANFWFFLLFYYGVYVAVALIYITQLFSLYRLNWWPSALGAKTSYTIFWLLSVACGYLLHRLNLDTLMAAPGSPRPGDAKEPADILSVSDIPNTLVTIAKSMIAQLCHFAIATLYTVHQVALSASVTSSRYTIEANRHSGPANDDDDDDDDDVQWQRKTLWVGLAFATMSMPALVCLIGLRRSGRQTYRHSLTDMQKTFLERQLARRIPASYIRFLWFVATIGLSLVALVAGQGYASVYLSTLPHTGFDGTAYVTFWMITVNLLSLMSGWILEEKVRSRALLFANKYYYFLVYFIFYRNLFARLRSFDQFALVQLFSSVWVCIFYPLSMTSLAHRITQHFNPRPKSWEEYVESIGLAIYLRNLAQNVTMVAFLGWVSILHFGRNQSLYPFFAFADRGDPYNYQLTMLGSGAIWASELITSFVARAICKAALGVDVTNLGLDEFREFPELLATCVWTSVHVLMDMLLFLIKLNFR